MARNNGRPSGVGKEESRTGIPTKMDDQNVQNDRDLTERYTEDDENLSDNLPLRHPNRNTGKDEATGIGGYRS